MAKKKAPEIVVPLDIERILGKPKNRVARVGVELEGAWEKLPPGVKLERDGSVFKGLDEGGLNRQGLPGFKVGELPIGPMQPAQLNSALRKFWPTKIDDSCGMHIHMSFETTLQYSLLADSPAYQETIIYYLLKWANEEKLPYAHPIWDRLRGNNKYCQKRFWPDLQIQRADKDHNQEREGHRYTMIHYCWSRTGTIECRILPMMETPELAGRGLRRIIDITNAYLSVVNKSRIKIGEKLELGSGDIYEEYYETEIQKPAKRIYRG